MAFDPNSAQSIEGYDSATNTIMAPPVNVGAFDPASAKMTDIIPFSDLINIESGGRQFNKVNGKPLMSSKGAIGIAQLLPATAKEAAGLAGLDWDKSKFLNDSEYNRKLGEAYYNKQLETFGGDSYKAAAAYNAGPARVKSLVDTFGDDWAKKLPLETQEYIAKLGYQGVAQPTKSVDAQNFTPASQPIIDYAQLAEAGKFGAGVGALVGAFPQAKAIVGAVRGGSAVIPAIARGGSIGDITAAGAKGFAESVLGSTAGQVYQYGKPENLETDLTRLGIEAATGGLSTSLYESGLGLTKKAASIFPSWLSETVTKPITALTGKTELEKQITANAFGRLKMRPGTSTSVFEDALINKQTQELGNTWGIQIPKGARPQDIVRSQMYKTIKDLESQGVKWIDSPQYKQLMAELDLSRIPAEVKKSIRNVASQQGSSVPENAAMFEKNLLNLAQQSSGDFAVKDVPIVAADLLKKHFDGFLQANSGVPYYSVLKKTEAENYAAVAHDSIPSLITNGFKENKTTKFALENIKNSPNGVRDLKLALTSYLGSVPEKKLLTEWVDLENLLRETKALPIDEIRALRKQVNIAKSVPEKAKVTATLLAKDSILTALSSEKARATKNPQKGTFTELISGEAPSLSAFNM